MASPGRLSNFPKVTQLVYSKGWIRTRACLTPGPLWLPMMSPGRLTRPQYGIIDMNEGYISISKSDLI